MRISSLIAILLPVAAAFGQGGGQGGGVEIRSSWSPTRTTPRPKSKADLSRIFPMASPTCRASWLVRAPGNSMSMLSVETLSNGRGGQRKGVITDPADWEDPLPAVGTCEAGGPCRQPHDRRIRRALPARRLSAHLLHALWIPPVTAAQRSRDGLGVHACLSGSPDGMGALTSTRRQSLYMGDSRGHWEGDTLVIDVTNQKGRSWIDQAADFHNGAIHVVERFTMTRLEQHGPTKRRSRTRKFTHAAVGRSPTSSASTTTRSTKRWNSPVSKASTTSNPSRRRPRPPRSSLVARKHSWPAASAFMPTLASISYRS